MAIARDASDWAVGKNTQRHQLSRLGHDLFEGLIIAVLSEDARTRVRSIEDVEDDAARGSAGRTWHGITVTCTHAHPVINWTYPLFSPLVSNVPFRLLFLIGHRLR